MADAAEAGDFSRVVLGIAVLSIFEVRLAAPATTFLVARAALSLD
jgi:hypothetical protein